MYDKYSAAKQILAGATVSTFFKSKAFYVSNQGTTAQGFTFEMRTGPAGASASALGVVGGATASVVGVVSASGDKVYPFEISGFTFSPANAAFRAYVLY